MDYEINKYTLAILSNSKTKSKVLEDYQEYIVNKESFEIIEHSCEYFGSSYEGRHDGTRNLIGVTHKAPIIIEESNNIIFFPTKSPREKDCIWISLNNLLNYKQGINPRTTIVEFKNGKQMIVNVSIGSFNNQLLRASRLENILNNRKK